MKRPTCHNRIMHQRSTPAHLLMEILRANTPTVSGRASTTVSWHRTTCTASSPRSMPPGGGRRRARWRDRGRGLQPPRKKVLNIFAGDHTETENDLRQGRLLYTSLALLLGR